MNASALSAPDKAPTNFGYPLKSTKIIKGFQASANQYGPGHRGTDFEASPGTAVYSIAPAQVIFVGSVNGHLYISLDHGSGIVSTYSVGTKAVKEGEVIEKGKLLGTVGKPLENDAENTFHFSMRVNDKYVDPMLYITGTIPVREISLTPIDADDRSLFEKARDWAKKQIENGLDFGKEIVDNFTQGVKDFYGWFEDSAKDTFNKFGEELSSVLKEFDEIKNKISDKVSEITSNMAKGAWDLVGKGVDALKDLQDIAFKYGKKIIDIGNKFTDLYNKMIKKAFKVGSGFAQFIFDKTKDLAFSGLKLFGSWATTLYDGGIAGLRATFKVLDANFDVDFGVLAREVLMPASCLFGGCTSPVKKTCDSSAKQGDVKTPGKEYKGSGNKAFMVSGINSEGSPIAGQGTPPTSIDYKTLGYKQSDVQYFSYKGTGQEFGKKDTYQDLNISAKLMDDQIKDFAKKNPGEKIDLFAHSLGGAVTSLWLAKFYDENDKSYPKLGKIIMYAPALSGTELADGGAKLDDNLVGRIVHNGAALIPGIPPSSSKAMQQVTEGGYIQKEIEKSGIMKKYEIYSLQYGSDYVVTSGSEHIDGLKEVPLEETPGDILGSHFTITDSDASMAQSQRILAGKKLACNTLGGSLGYIAGSSLVHAFEYKVGDLIGMIGGK